jgi:hypothetical protein
MVKATDNCKVAANIIRDYQLATLIPIESVNLSLRDLHLQIQSRPPPKHA